MDGGIFGDPMGKDAATRQHGAGRSPRNQTNDSIGELVRPILQQAEERMQAHGAEAPQPDAEPHRPQDVPDARKSKAETSSKRKQYGCLSLKEIIWLKDCNRTAYTVYTILLTFRDPNTWETFVPIGYPLIAKASGYGDKTVKRAVKELMDKGKIRRKEGTGNGRGKRSVYVFEFERGRGSGGTGET